MPTIKLPQNLIAKQNNLGELISEIWSSWNLDLTSENGRIKISPRTKKVNTDSDSGLGALVKPFAIKRSQARGSDEWWVGCNQKLFYSNASPSPFTSLIADGTANSPTTALDTLYSDIEEFSGNLIVTLKTDIARLVAGTWTATWWTGAGTLNQRAMVTGIPHAAKVGFNNLLLVADQVVSANEAGKGEAAGQASVHAIDIASNVSLNRLLFKKQFKVTFILSSSTEYWIGLSHKFSGRAEVARWDGSSVNFNDSFKLNDKDVYSGVILDEVPHVVDGRGRLLAFGGSGFKEVGRLPIANDKYIRWGADNSASPIHRNGMAIVNGKVNMFVGSSTTRFSENMNCGIWEHDENIGLYHKYGITNGNSTSAADMMSPLVDYPGPIVETEHAYGTIFGGCRMTSDNGTTWVNMTFLLDIIDSNGNITDTTLKVGYLVTKKMTGAWLEENWSRMAMTFDKLLNSTDRIYIKYRTDFKNYTNSWFKFCTWSTTTQFTSASSQTWSDVSVGDEVEILEGKGAGICAKITAISLVSTTYTITIDYAVSGASNGDTFAVRVQNWTVLPYNSSQDYISDQTLRYQDLPVNDKATELQLKIVMFGKGDSPKLTIILSKSNENVTLE